MAPPLTQHGSSPDPNPRAGENSTAGPKHPSTLAAFVILAVCFLAACSTPPPKSNRSRTSLPVLRVIDGDTLVIDAPDGEETVRLREINTPEKGECGGAAATARLAALSSGGVWVDRRGTDRYGRTLAHVYTVSRVHVQYDLVLAGLAHVATYGSPDEHLDRLFDAEARARINRHGLYGDGLGCGKALPDPTIAAPGLVSVLRVDANPDGDDLEPGGGESVTIGGPPGTSLAGWSLKDTSASHRFKFDPGTTIPESGALRIFTSCGQPTAGSLFWCMKGSAVWNNGGDTAFLLGPGGQIVSWLDYHPP